MTWAKLDDRFHANRKVKRAWKADMRCVGLHAMALSYSAGNDLDGFVDVEFVEEKLPRARDLKAITDSLVSVGLWEVVEDGWTIHDYLDYNPSAAQIAERRRVDADRKAAARSGRSPNGHASDSPEIPRIGRV